MAKTLGVWGIDIGQCALKALRLEVIDGQPTVTAFDYVEHPKILSQPDADPDALTREALEKFLSRNALGKDHMAVGVPGQAGLVRFVKLPPVEEKKVMEIVKFEAKQQIPFPLEEVVWDYQKLSDKQEVIGGFAMETEIGLFAMKRDIIARQLAHYQGVKAEVHLVQMAPLALANYATYELLKKRGEASVEEPAGDLPPGKKKKCVVVLDIGTEGSNLLITDGVKVIWQRPVPLGGNNFTRVLTKELKLTFAKAEHLKRNAAKSPDLAQILKALRPVLTDFVGEVQRSLGYFTNTHRDAHVAYMVGLGSAFKLPGLQKYLSEKLSLEVRKPTKIEGVVGDAVLNDAVFQENVLTFPVAYGLALQGLSALQIDPEQQKRYALLRTNLLPHEIHIDRLIRAKKPWAAAAAAALLVGVAGVAAGLGCQYRAATDAEMIKAQDAAGQAVKSAGDQNGRFKTKEGEVTAKRADVKALVAGHDERLNWVRLNEVVSAALPRPPLLKLGTDPKTPYVWVTGPDGKTALDQGNLRLDFRDKGVRDKEEWLAQQEYLDRQNAYESIVKYSERVLSGVPTDKLFITTRVEALPLVNIEALDCRYTDNLQAFLDKANTEGQKTYDTHIVADLMPERTLKVKTTVKGADGKDEEKDEDVKIAAEKDPADPPNAKGTAAWHKFNPKAPSGPGWVVEVRGYTYHTDSHEFVRFTLVRNLQEAGTKFAEETVKPGEEVSKIIPGVKDPVFGKVSHAFLYAWKSIKADEIAKDKVPTLTLSASSQLDRLIAPVAAAPTDGGLPGGGSGGGGPGAPSPGSITPGGGPGPSSGPPGMPGSPDAAAGSGGWTGLLGFGGGSRGNIDGGGFLFGDGAGGPGGLGLPPVGPGNPPPADKPGSKKSKEITEFIVYFIWQEPTGSDPTAAPTPPK